MENEEMSQVEVMELQQFNCPKCGSHRFVSSLHGLRSVPPMKRTTERNDILLRWPMLSKPNGICLGPGCSFTWSRTEDVKYFVGTGIFMPKCALATCLF